MIRLPKWVIPHKFPAMFDTESATAIEMTAKLYGAMNSLIEEYNKFIENVETIINGYGDTVLEEGINKNEVFRVAIRQEFQDFMDAVETHLDVQNKNVEEYASKVANNDQLFEQFTTALLNDIREVEERVTSIEENGVNNSAQPDLAENDPNSPSYVQNRTHWKETKEIVTNIMPEKTITSRSDIGYGANANVMLATGTPYRVTWNNVNYECVCHNVFGFYVLGGEGEPFTLKQEGGRAWVDIFPTVEEFPFTVSIELVTGVEDSYHTLDSNYLPDDVPHIAKGNIIDVLPECTPQSYDMGFIITNDLPEFEVDKTYIVNWNGIDYSCASLEFDSFIFLGNESTLDGPDNGLPFTIVKGDVGYGMALNIIPTDGSTSLTISIKKQEETVHKINVRLLPDNVLNNSIIIKPLSYDDNGLPSKSDFNGKEICELMSSSNMPAIYFIINGTALPLVKCDNGNYTVTFENIFTNKISNGNFALYHNVVQVDVNGNITYTPMEQITMS